ncbi:succinate dehydrogenase assembly factor 2 [Elongatibacter sediminis]|uniref:FAD assembly factor SdhE n=1 Tax=Elongatibacter sediminis TaxID=3119006 RepID=A0AAW9R7A3_9GAMM
MPSVTNRRVRRLKWLCRRGMKELDLMLERFLASEQDSLEHGAWPELESLLQTEDDRLWDWLQNSQHPDARPYRALLDRIRHDTEFRH